MSQERPAQNQPEVNYYRGGLRFASSLLMAGGLLTTVLGIAENSNHQQEKDDQRDAIEQLIKARPDSADDLLRYEDYITYHNEVPDYYLMVVGIASLTSGGFFLGTSLSTHAQRQSKLQNPKLEDLNQQAIDNP